MIRVRATVELMQSDILRDLGRSEGMTGNNYEGLIGFLTDLDEYVDDLQFTVALRDRLNEIIEECDS